MHAYWDNLIGNSKLGGIRTEEGGGLGVIITIGWDLGPDPKTRSKR